MDYAMALELVDEEFVPTDTDYLDLYLAQREADIEFYSAAHAFVEETFDPDA